MLRPPRERVQGPGERGPGARLMYGAAKFCDHEFYPDECHRYALLRRWGYGPAVNFVMLNPSTADEKADDPTIRRCIRFAQRAGYGALYVTNLFAYRATDPRRLLLAGDPVGERNDRWIERLASRAAFTVVAWGARDTGGRDRAVLRLLEGSATHIYALGYTADGSPRHPLYLRNEAPLVPYRP